METTTSRKRDRGNDCTADNGIGRLAEDDAPEEAFFRRLVDPDFEELARQVPAFGVAWRRAVAESTHYRGHHSHYNHRWSTHMTPECSVALCQALLRVYFGVVLTHLPFLEEDDVTMTTNPSQATTNSTSNEREIHLCPPVPNRYFYVRWIQNELLPRGQDSQYFEAPTQGRSVTVGLDIGTGAVCIYPLLMVSSWPKCQTNSSSNTGVSIVMHATDIDERSVTSARTNVNGNSTLAPHIHVWHVPASDRQQQQQQQQHGEWTAAATNNPAMMAVDCDDNNEMHGTDPFSSEFPVGPLRRSLEHINESKVPNTTMEPLAFTMTNPPFFDLDEFSAIQEDNSRRGHGHAQDGSEARDGASLFDGRPRTSMTKNEGCYPGGEVGFVLDTIVDGLYLYSRHQQYRHDISATPSRPDAPRCPPPPLWTSTMCGKKTSLVRLHHIVTQLLGPAHVCSTEFGPGHLTRWFLAWTFQRPSGRSPLARLPAWTFAVPSTSLNGSYNVLDACRDMVGRIVHYGTALHLTSDFSEATTTGAPNLDRAVQMLQLRESQIAPPPWKDDDALPDTIQHILAAMDPSVRLGFLPVEGHVLLDVEVVVSTGSDVSVQVQPYHHSSYGKKLIEKIKSQLESEVCRTNRRWRRILQREQQAACAPDEHRHAMDDST